MNKKFTALNIACLMLSLFLWSSYAFAVEIDKTAIVSYVKDGDTFVLESEEEVRFADINTPESDDPVYIEAKNYVKNLVEGKIVYLDIDNISRTDKYNRLVCVVYFDYNSTHIKNLNKALLIDDLAVIDNYDNNEFNPNTWDLYVSKTVIPEYPTIAIIAIVFIIATMFLVAIKSAKGNFSITI